MKKHRISVSVLFFINGFIHANWASRLPELQEFLDISYATLGSVLFVLALGAIVAMPFTGWLAYRFGSNVVTRMTGLLLCLASSVLSIQTGLYFEGVVFFVLGFANGAMDVAMNEQAVLVEREYRKPIMSSFHAFWSVGMSIGAGAGALFSKFGVSLMVHNISVAVLGLVVVLWSSSGLIKTANADQQKQEASFMLPTRAIVPLGLIAFCAMLSEGSMIDWSAIYVKEVIGSTAAFSAFAFGVYNTAMTLGRVIGDYLTQKLGKKRLLVLDSVLAITGLSLFLLFPVTWISIISLFAMGIGLSTIVPIIYTTAGNTEGVSPSVGIAMATTIGYSGFFVGPPTIGYLADVYGLRVGLIFTLILLTIMFGLIIRRKFESRP